MPVIRLILALALLSQPAMAAFSATTQWDVRTTGSDSNGGGFDTASAGTNYAKQDSPQVTYTDMVVDAATNTKFTSAGNPCQTAYVGNVINVTSGTGFTVQRVQVTSCTSTTYNVDKSLGTLGSTGGNGKLGGGLLTNATAAGLAIAKNTINIQSGSYTVTTSITLNTAVTLIGYQTTWADGGAKPLITSSTNSINIFSAATTGCCTFDNLYITSTAATRGSGIVATNGTYPIIILRNSVIDGTKWGVIGDNSSFTAAIIYIINSEIKNTTTGGAGVTSFFNLTVMDSAIHNNTGDGLVFVGGSDHPVVVERSLIYSNGGKGINTNGTTINYLTVLSSTIASNTGDGIGGLPANFSLVLQNTILYGNGGWGINASGFTGTLSCNQYNAFGANTSGNANGISTGTGAVTLTANPFLNSAGGNFGLNSTAGGGALLKKTGYPGAFPGGVSTGYMDIGAVQSNAGGTFGYAFVQ